MVKNRVSIWSSRFLVVCSRFLVLRTWNLKPGTYLVCLICASIAVIPGKAADYDTDYLMSEFQKIHPEKVIVSSRIQTRDISQLVYEHLLRSPELKALMLQDRNLEHSIESIRQLFTPNLNMGLTYDNYDSYYREVIVNKSVPVRWDFENPIISNISLPNGGQGIIWLPRPLSWEKHDIPLNASLDYRSHVANSNFSLSYMTDFGLQVNALNYDLSYRFEPKTYGFPWSSTINSNIFLPLAKNLGYWGNSLNITKELSELDRKITNLNYRSLKNSVTAGVVSDFIQLSLNYRKLAILKNLNDILSVQLEDIDLLTENKRVTVSDNINMRSKQRNIKFQINYLVNNIFLLSSRLNPEFITSDTAVLYVPCDIDLEKLISSANRIVDGHLRNSEMQTLIDEHPQTAISELRLKQSDISLKYAENQDKPDLSLLGSIGTLQVNNLGFKQPWDSWKHIFYRPDGITWSIGFQYVLPFGHAADENLLSSMAEKQMNSEYLVNSKTMISDKLKQHVYYLENARDAISNSMSNYKDVRDMLDRQATPLFESNRMNRYDYNSYKSEIENAGLMINDAYVAYFQEFFAFTADMSIDLDQYIGEIK